MQITIAQLHDTSFQTAMQHIVGREDISAALSFKLARVARAIKKELEIYDEARRNIVKSYANLDEHGNVKTIPDTSIADIPENNKPKVNAKIEELMAQKVELPEISIADFGELMIKPSILACLEFIVE